MNFYHANNSNRAIVLAGIQIQFSHYEQTGTWLGVYSATKPEEIAALDEAVKNPKTGITTITADEYQRCIAIKRKASGTYAPSLAADTPTPGVSDEPQQTVDSLPALDPSEPPPAPLETVLEAIEVVPLQKRTKK